MRPAPRSRRPVGGRLAGLRLAAARLAAVRVGAALLLVLTLGACSALPDSGVVHRDAGSGTGADEDSARFTAPGPGQGDAPIQIVNGFLTAMTTNPAVTSSARSFLSRRARASWNPVDSTLVYDSVAVTAGRGSTVDVRMSDPQRLDSRGGWLGEASASASRLTLRIVKERGEWRIDDPPPALLVPRYFLTQEYEPYNLYFFDQAEQVLVPDRVYIPRGEQTASQLVRALLAGPGTRLAPVTRTAFPARSQLDLSVSISDDGTAEVPLSRAMLGLSPADLGRAAAQLSWTLRQVPGVERIRLAVDNTTLPVAGAGRDYDNAAADAYAPTVRGSQDEVYTLAEGRLALLDPIGAAATRPRPVTGPLGGAGYRLRSFAVSLSGSAVAAVTADGRGVLQAPVRRSGATSRAPRRIYSGTDLLPPAYDALGEVWLVDRTANGARVVQVTRGGTRVVDVPGVTGRSVSAFLVSRVGAQLVAIVDGARDGRDAQVTQDRVVTADLLRTRDGDLIRATTARTDTAVPDRMGDLVDIAWTSPQDLAVLGHPSRRLSRIALVSVDGSPGDDRTVTPDTWTGAARGLVGAPDRNATLYLLTSGGRLRSLDDSGLWRRTGVPAGQVAPTYVG